MKRGFTLLELLVVIIILTVLAALGLGQYSRVVEKSRSTEARKIIGDIRDLATAYYQYHGTMTGFGIDEAGIGLGFDQIPFSCRTSHYFNYFIDNGATHDNFLRIVANRCLTGAGGKNPGWNGAVAQIHLTSTMGGAAPIDTWTLNPPYN